MCNECLNYDLCSACMTLENHKKHCKDHDPSAPPSYTEMPLGKVCDWDTGVCALALATLKA